MIDDQLQSGGSLTVFMPVQNERQRSPALVGFNKPAIYRLVTTSEIRSVGSSVNFPGLPPPHAVLT